jgi:hypothetical protein
VLRKNFFQLLEVVKMITIFKGIAVSVGGAVNEIGHLDI